MRFDWRPPAWHDRAACRGADTDLWFPFDARLSNSREAKAVCATCTVRAECLEQGMSEPAGIWGGKTVRERWMLRKGTA